MKKYESVHDFLGHVARRNPGQPEFLQAVTEVMASLWPFIAAHPRYAEQGLLERLVEPERVVMFRVAWVDDHGEVQVNRGYRIQHSSAIGPYKGGMRFHPSVNLSILKFLAFEQTLKNALTTLPMGGAKGGSDFDPKGKSPGEVMRFCQALVTELFRHVGSDTDVPAGDIGVGAREVGFMAGMMKKLSNRADCVFTGKGLAFGGSLIRPEATGYGTVYFAAGDAGARRARLRRPARRRVGLGQRRAVRGREGDGAGRQGRHRVRFERHGDRRGRLHRRQARRADGGEEPPLRPRRRLRAARARTLRAGQPAVGRAGRHRAALRDAERARRRRRRHPDRRNGVGCVAEGANMPTTIEAVRRFQAAGVLYAPGKASNAGGVATSGLEMSQNAMRLAWPRDEVDSRLRSIMVGIHEACLHHGLRRDGSVDYADGANIAGFVKVADAMQAQGVI